MISVKQFQKTILDFYQANGRDLPWRKTNDPYAILVSEVMLQQTQADRVIPKFNTWLAHFPTFEALASAPLQEVLRLWQGLGYNRRAISLKKAAEKVIEEYNGVLPNDPEKIAELPGIGPATASAICAYAFNAPVIFIETNIRAVFIHFFFNTDSADDEQIAQIADDEIFPLVEKALDKANPRRWYNALMDYGVKLKKEFKNPSRRSAHHVKQSKFEGSNRQLRGKMVKLLIENQRLKIEDFVRETGAPQEQIEKNLAQLRKEGFVPNEE